ncbi:MAG: hypothetical protein Q7O66_13415 [Dehalococcoidia bacterium]|nr:hypothetical protein [Dehalococcoidia bacterium]
MSLEKFCPGSTSVRSPLPESIKCLNCDEEVEIWTDELRADCPKCGKTVFREQAPSCLDWCKFARQCVGDEAYERLKEGKTGGVQDH